MGPGWWTGLQLWWTAALCLVALGVWCWLWATRLRTTAPGPTPLPLIGNVLQIGREPLRLSQLRDLHRRYGDVFRFYVGTKLCIMVTQPEDAHRVMVAMKQRVRDPFFMHPLRIVLGDGLITCNWETWRTHRRIVEPMFRTEVLERSVGAFDAAGAFLCGRLEAAGGAELDLLQPLFQASLRALTAAVFGVPLDHWQPDRGRQADAVAELVSLIKALERRIFKGWIQTKLTGSKMFAGSKTRRQLRLFHSLVSLILNSSEVLLNGEGRTLVHLLSAPVGGRRLSPNEVHDEICTFLAAGTETTTSTLGFVLVLLSLHPEWQEAAHQELDAVFGTGGEYLRPTTTDTLAQLPVLESIIKEALRLFPVVPSLASQASEDVLLAGGRFVAPRGSCVVVAFTLLHRQPRHFPEPHRFDPARFLPGGSALNRHPHSFLPFGAGSRRCVGGRFAMLQMKSTLAAVLRRFRLLPGSASPLLEDFPLYVTIFPQKGFRVVCIPRDRTPLAAA